MQTTLVLLKPDTIERWLIWNVISRIENKWLKISGMKMIQLDNEIINEHYSHIADKPFFPKIEKYMQRTPIIAIAVTGINAVATVRKLIWATNPVDALPGTIRWDLALTVDANIVHASDSPEAAEVELQRFFKGEWLFDYNRVIDSII